MHDYFDLVMGLRAKRYAQACLFAVCGTLLSGCPKKQEAVKFAQVAEGAEDFDAAVGYYEQAAKLHPNDSHLRLRLANARFEASNAHLHSGRISFDQHQLEEATREFRSAALLDPSSEAAQESLAAALAAATQAAAEPQPIGPKESLAYADHPPELKPLQQSPIHLKMANDSRIVYETIAKLAGVNVIFDPDFVSKRITVELDNVALCEALEVVGIESKAFWKPLSTNTFAVFPDQQQKHRDYDDQILQTFHLANTAQAQDLTELVTGLRQMLDLKKIQQLNGQNAVMIRDTPAKLAAVRKIIEDADRAKPEVVVQVEVLQARTDVSHKLGISPGTSASLTFNYGCGNSSSSDCSSSSSSSTTSNFTLRNLSHLNSGDFNVTLPGATITALLSDSSTQLIQNPELRSVDGQPAKLRVGDRVPVATGSYQTGAAATTTSVSALVSTQYQYIDVGVNVDITPHIHPNRDVSMKLAIEVSSVSGYSTIGSLQEPIISQRKIEQEIRLKEGEVSILGGLFERSQSRSKNGWPGISHIPFLGYLTSERDNEIQNNEILIVLIPRVVRYPQITLANQSALYTGSEANFQLKPVVAREKEAESGLASGTASKPKTGSDVDHNGVPAIGFATEEAHSTPVLAFDPPELDLHAGQTSTIRLNIQGANDLFSVAALFQYDPKKISIEEVRHGQFFSNGGAETAVVQQIDKERGVAVVSAMRPPKAAGISGNGTVLEIVVRALSEGAGQFAVSEIRAKDSQGEPIPVATVQLPVRVSN
jgi:general secretion pathway protein D